MASKKDLSGIQTGRLHDSIATSTSKAGQQGEASPEEKARRAAEGRTQGRKGCKQPRMTVNFTTENYKFLRTVAAASGTTIKGLVNLIIQDYRKAHPDLYADALDYVSRVRASGILDISEDDLHDVPADSEEEGTE